LVIFGFLMRPEARFEGGADVDWQARVIGSIEDDQKLTLRSPIVPIAPENAL
jgi:hypothetical protein